MHWGFGIGKWVLGCALGTIACGSSEGSDGSNGGAPGNGGSGGGAPADGDLYADTFLCGPEAAGGRWLRLQGSLDSSVVELGATSASNIERGALYTYDDPLEFRVEWEQDIRLAAPGTNIPITGGHLTPPPGAAPTGTHCWTSGELGRAPPEQQPPPGIGIRFRFKITGAVRGAACDGPSVPVNLEGCWFRSNSFLP